MFQKYISDYFTTYRTSAQPKKENFSAAWGKNAGKTGNSGEFF